MAAEILLQTLWGVILARLLWLSVAVLHDDNFSLFQPSRCHALVLQKYGSLSHFPAKRERKTSLAKYAR